MTTTATTTMKLTAGNITRILNGAGYRQGTWNRTTERITSTGFFTDYNNWAGNEYVSVSYEYTGRYITQTAEQTATANGIVGHMAITLMTAGFQVELKRGYNGETVELKVTK